MDADVIVVGAGPAGSAAAAQLAHAGHDVLLIDKVAFPRDKTCGDAITPRGVRALQHLGAFESIAARAHRLDGASLVSPSGLTLRVSFNDVLRDWPPFALVLPRVQMDDLLLAFALSKGARFMGECRVVGLFETSGGAGVIARQGPEDRPVAWSARTVVLAVGAHMGLLQQAGLLRETPPVISAARAYWQNVDGDPDNLCFYFDRRLPLGYAWLFPTGPRQANIGLGVFPGSPARQGQSTPALLADFVRHYPPLRERLQRAGPVGPTRAFPIRADFPPPRLTQNRFLLVGEACGLVNPVTGEGIDLALESGLIAAESIHHALKARASASAPFERYEQALRRRFSAYFRELRWLRNIVMRRRPLEILIDRSSRRPDLLAVITRLSLGLISPRVAFSPRVWRDLLF